MFICMNGHCGFSNRSSLTLASGPSNRLSQFHFIACPTKTRLNLAKILHLVSNRRFRECNTVNLYNCGSLLAFVLVASRQRRVEFVRGQSFIDPLFPTDISARDSCFIIIIASSVSAVRSLLQRTEFAPCLVYKWSLDWG